MVRLTRRQGLHLAAAALLGAPVAAAGTERLVHAEDFSHGQWLDLGFWMLETGFFRNREEQYYQPDNVFVRDGALALEGRAERLRNAAFDPAGGDWTRTTEFADFTSGSIVSRRPFLYGAFEVVARIPAGLGTWPAIWLVNEVGVPYREIDIMEAVGISPDRVFSAVHAGPSLADLRHWQAETVVPDLTADFHTYRLDWRPDALSIAVDGRRILTMDPGDGRKDGFDPLRQPMHLRINLALGGSWGGKIDGAALPALFRIRSIRIWQDET